MTRLTRLLAVLCAFALCSSGVPAQAGELPPGFVDGAPVGEEAGGPPMSGNVSTAATTERYFGQEAYTSVREAVAATTRSCAISNDALTAMVLAPVFKESSAATTAATAPAPMTLSRYDEWSGTFTTTSNKDANYGLYAFRDPSTAYQRAYWHPGIGIWQYDSAGLGAPYTTVETMDVRVMAGAVATNMSGRYCVASGTALERRYAAWTDWGYPCTLCEGFYQEMVGSAPPFQNLTLVPGITRLGGTVAHSCRVAGVATPVTCWYVEPRVGVIEGATAWATLSPDGGSGPTVAPAPLSHPFYVLDRGATEERHWLREDTGYSIDISAVRTIGKNARPRSNQAGSGLTWRSTSGLCDLTVTRGSCTPIPPSGVNSTPIAVNGDYRSYGGDFDANGIGDILWYAPGTAGDGLWLGTGSGAFTKLGITVNGSYDQVVVLDADKDGRDDILWYDSTGGARSLWRSTGAGQFAGTVLSPRTGKQAIAVDVDGDGRDEVLWYAPGSGADRVESLAGAPTMSVARTISGRYRPLVGDFDANGTDDVFWYGSGSAADGLWLHTPGSGAPLPVAQSIALVAAPVVGDLDGDGRDDIVWYGPSTAPDSLWFGAATPSRFAPVSTSVNGSYYPVVVDLDGNSRDEILWYAPGDTADGLWSWSSSRVLTTASLRVPGLYQAIPGSYRSSGGVRGVVWNASGARADVVWW